MIMAPMAEIPSDRTGGGGRALLEREGRHAPCLASLAESTYEPLEVIVVDNGSSDGSPEAVEAEFPAAVVIRMGLNAGFSGGVNAGVAAAIDRGADAVLLLNNDMVVEPGFLGPLVAAALEDGVAAACSQILFAEIPDRVWYAGATFRPRRGYHGRNIGFGEAPLPASLPPYRVDCACGGAMLMSREAIDEIGLFDEQLFAYREDLDWSLRATARAGRWSCRTGEHRAPPGLGVDRWRVLADIALLRHAQRPRRVRAVCAARARLHLAQARRVGAGPPRAGRDVASASRGNAGGAGRLA